MHLLSFRIYCLSKQLLLLQLRYIVSPSFFLERLSHVFFVKAASYKTIVNFYGSVQ